MKLREVYERIDALYPKKISDDYVAAYGGHDNSGILLDGGHEIAGALFSLDLSQGAIAAAVALMSISSLFYIITGQWLFGKIMQLVPVSGWSDGAGCVAFLALPVAIGVFAQLGSGTLLYRAMFLEELNKDYVRCVRAKGITETRILFGHVLRNASLPIVTSTVAVIPSLFISRVSPDRTLKVS